MADDGRLLSRARLVEGAAALRAAERAALSDLPAWTCIRLERPLLEPYLDVEASEISFPSGVVMGAINDAVAVISGRPRPPKRRSALEGMTLGIEVLPPGHQRTLTCHHPRRTRQRPRQCRPGRSPRPSCGLLAGDRGEHPTGRSAWTRKSFHQRVERQLGVQIARERFLAARMTWHLISSDRVGRPRKNAQ